MEPKIEIDWKKLELLAKRICHPGRGGGRITQEELLIIGEALNILITQQNDAGMIRLRRLFNEVIANDSISVHRILQQLSDRAIQAAHRIGDIKEEAHLLGANGHNLHRQGFHQQAIDNFSRSHQLYEQADESHSAMKSYFMMALCQRALGNFTEAKRILKTVLSNANPKDSWYGNPLNVLAWIKRDEGQLGSAEELLRKALLLHQKSPNPDILMAGAFADLGEVLSSQRRFDDAMDNFQKSLDLIRKYQGQFDRQEARTETKLAELFIRKKEYLKALSLLDHADDLIAFSTYKDQLWKIELLRAMVKLRQGNIKGALRRIRSARTILHKTHHVAHLKRFKSHSLNGVCRTA